jgi:hypothetical protein
VIHVWEDSRSCFRNVTYCLFPCLIIWIIHKWNKFVISLKLFMLPVIFTDMLCLTSEYVLKHTRFCIWALIVNKPRPCISDDRKLHLHLWRALMYFLWCSLVSWHIWTNCQKVKETAYFITFLFCLYVYKTWQHSTQQRTLFYASDVCWTMLHCDNWRIKNQLDFIVLLISSKCFGHYYAHHQELATMMLAISFLVCCRLEVRWG